MTTPTRGYHIAHIMPFASLGGTEVAALRMMQGLPEARFYHTVFCPAGAKVVQDKFARAGFETATYNEVEMSFRNPHPYLGHSYQLAREFARRKVDLVHCQEILAAYRGVLAGKLAGRPVLCHVRAQRSDIGWRERLLLATVNHFVFVSQDTWKSLGFEVPARRGTVVYDGLEPIDLKEGDDAKSVRAEFGIPADAPIVGMVARVAREKDFTTLIKAAARVVAVRPDVRFLMVGDYSSLSGFREHYAEVQTLLATSGMTPYFIFTDHREDVPRLRAAMDMCVLCTHTEGFGLAVLEGMAQGKPVLATAVGGLPEAITNGQTGFLHRHEDDEQLASQILTLLADPVLSARLGAVGRQSVQDRFNQNRFIRGICTIYDKLLTRRTRLSQSDLSEAAAANLARTRNLLKGERKA